MRYPLWVAFAIVGTVAITSASDGHAQARSKDGFLRPGATGSRIGVGLFGVHYKNADGSEETSFGASVAFGLSYALHSRIAIDADSDLLFGFTPDLDLLQVELTPGARFFFNPRLYARGAYSVRLLDPMNQLALLGGGYYLTQGSLAAYLELNYIAWSQHPVDPPILPRFGLEVRF